VVRLTKRDIGAVGQEHTAHKHCAGMHKGTAGSEHHNGLLPMSAALTASHRTV
jgi:hypothetical protein